MWTTSALLNIYHYLSSIPEFLLTVLSFSCAPLLVGSSAEEISLSIDKNDGRSVELVTFLSVARLIGDGEPLEGCSLGLPRKELVDEVDCISVDTSGTAGNRESCGNNRGLEKT